MPWSSAYVGLDIFVHVRGLLRRLQASPAETSSPLGSGTGAPPSTPTAPGPRLPNRARENHQGGRRAGAGGWVHAGKIATAGGGGEGDVRPRISAGVGIQPIDDFCGRGLCWYRVEYGPSGRHPDFTLAQPLQSQGVASREKEREREKERGREGGRDGHTDGRTEGGRVGSACAITTRKRNETKRNTYLCGEVILVPLLAALGLDPRHQRLRKKLVGALQAHAPLPARVAPLGVEADGPFPRQQQKQRYTRQQQKQEAATRAKHQGQQHQQQLSRHKSRGPERAGWVCVWKLTCSNVLRRTGGGLIPLGNTTRLLETRWDATSNMSNKVNRQKTIQVFG